MTKYVPHYDKLFVANIVNLMHLVRVDDWDWLMVFDGDERVGKSTIAMHVLLIAEPKLARDIACGIYKNVLARLAWSFDSMVELVRTMPDGTAMIYDEASLLGREAMREHNLRMVRVMSTVGLRNRLYVWTFPDFYMLDPYLRDGRVRTRGYVRSIKGERGYVTWYVRQRYPFPRPGGETVWWKRGFDTRFSSVASMSKNHAELWELYRERDTSAKDAILEGSQPDARREIALRLRAEGMNIRQIADTVGRSLGTTGIWLKGVKAGDKKR